MHQIAPFFLIEFFPDPLVWVCLNIITGFLRGWYVTIYLVYKMIFRKTLMNSDQIYTFLMYLKLNLGIGPNSNCNKEFLYSYNNLMVSLCLKTKSSFSCWKNGISPTRKPTILKPIQTNYSWPNANKIEMIFCLYMYMCILICKHLAVLTSKFLGLKLQKEEWFSE